MEAAKQSHSLKSLSISTNKIKQKINIPHSIINNNNIFSSNNNYSMFNKIYSSNLTFQKKKIKIKKINSKIIFQLLSRKFNSYNNLRPRKNNKAV